MLKLSNISYIINPNIIKEIKQRLRNIKKYIQKYLGRVME